ncbi:MAG: hypothetical protein AAFU03_10415 [Bacteroidota bacterium]
MCGILGAINTSFDQSTLELIKHRGPDDTGMITTEVNEHALQFGQCRLSIIDLSEAGHQPMTTDCGQYTIIYNGEIYNHLDLREKLPSTVQFKGHSDTETILYYLKEYGITGVKDFNGIFAIALLDKNAGQLYLARDPFGVKPLYYYEGEGNALVFSSELSPIRNLVADAQGVIRKQVLLYYAFAIIRLPTRFMPTSKRYNRDIT